MGTSKFSVIGIAAAVGAVGVAGITGNLPGGGAQGIAERAQERTETIGDKPVTLDNERLKALEESEIAEKSADDYIRFCFPDGLEGRVCVDRQTLLSKRKDPRVRRMLESFSGEGPEEMSLNHPTDYQRPAKRVGNCKSFNEMKQQGWAGISSADMADESRFVLRCGLIKMAQKATVPSNSYFINERLTSETLQSIPVESLPYIGEKVSDAEAVVVTAPGGDGVWALSNDTTISVLTEISHADFNGDGSGDILIFMISSAVDGSARVSSYGLMEHAESGVSFSRLELYK